MNKILKDIFLKDKNNELGFIRVSFSIFGGLLLAYLSIMFLSQYLTFSIFENVVIAIILLPIFWASYSLVIIMSKTKFIAILKTIIPAIILYLLIFGAK